METGEAIEVPTEAAIDGDSTSPEMRDFEAEAKAMGWTPKDDFKGDDKRWIDAETFVKRGEEMMPILKAQNKKLRQDMDDLKRQMKKAADHFSKAEERAFQKALAEIDRKHAEAVEVGDVAGARKAVVEMRELEKDFSSEVPAAAEPTDQKQIAAEFQAWVEANDWYGADDAKTRYADLQAGLMGPAEEWPQGRKAWFAEIEKKVDAKFAARPPVVNAAPGARPAGKSTSRTYADLPPDAKKLCDKWVSQGVIKDRATYVNSFQWD